jgi:hypothetical protein
MALTTKFICESIGTEEDKSIKLSLINNADQNFQAGGLVLIPKDSFDVEANFEVDGEYEITINKIVQS